MVNGDELAVTLYEMTDSISSELKELWNVSTIPTLIFALPDGDLDYPVARLIGNQITMDNIQSLLYTLEQVESLGDGEFEVNGTVIGEGNELQLGGLGFNLFNWNLNIPAILWLAFAGLAGYKTLKESKNNTKYIWGAGTTIAFGNYLNKKNG